MCIKYAIYIATHKNDICEIHIFSAKYIYISYRVDGLFLTTFAPFLVTIF